MIFVVGLIGGVTVVGVVLIAVIVVIVCKMRLVFVLFNMWQYNSHCFEFIKTLHKLRDKQ